MKNCLLLTAAAFGYLAFVTSCSKEDDFPSYGEVQKNTYTANFVAKYGPISPDQTWDFTTGESQLAKTRGFSSINTEIMEKGISFGDVSKLQTTRVTFNGHPEWDYDLIKGGATKNNDLLTAIGEVLPEKKQWTGKPAVLVAPASSFYIYPLFSGGNFRYDLKVRVGDEEPITVFSKDYTNFQTINGMKKANGEIVNMRGIRIEAPVGTPVEVYLDNLTTLEGNKIDKAAGTTNGRAVYVDIPKNIQPELEDVELMENAVVKYIGFEDAFSGSDNDYNDLVIAVIGNPDVPQERIITQDKYQVTTCRGKRFMIEDLGATGDFDFNDVVVDVLDYTVETHKVTSENGIKKSDEIESTTNEPTQAIIRALGGTIDFELTIGTTKWVKSENGFNVETMYNTQPTIDYDAELAKYEVSGWDYNSNNISFNADGKDGRLYTIKFPKTGETPMMIAVDPTQDWMNERVSVPRTWFYKE